jgi:hypothetical protein
MQLPDIRPFGDYDRLERRRSTFRFGSLKRKTPTPENIREHAFLRHRIGSRGSPRPSLQLLGQRKLASPIADRQMQKVRQSLALGVSCFDRHADKATRSLPRAIALRPRRDASHSKALRAKCLRDGHSVSSPESRDRQSACLPKPRRRQAQVSSRRFWLFNVRT